MAFKKMYYVKNRALEGYEGTLEGYEGTLEGWLRKIKLKHRHQIS